MARQIIAVGSAGNDGTGDTLRAGAIKMNANFAELYQDVANLGVLVTDSTGGLNLEGISFDQRSLVFIGVDSPNSTPADTNETFLRATEPTKDNIITLPDSTGTVALISDIARLTLDSDLINSFVAAGTDSTAVISLIEEHSIDSVGVINLIDTTYINNRVDPGLDSTLTRQEIDTYVTKSYLTLNNLVLDSGDVDNLFTSGFTSRFDSNIGNVTADVVPYDGLTGIDLGTNTNRFRNIFATNIFATTSVEIDSARLSYNSTFNSLNLANVEILRLNEGTDSATVRINTSGANVPQLLSNATLAPSAAVNQLDLGDSNFKWNDLYVGGSAKIGSTNQWVITVDGSNNLVFSYGGTDVAKIASSGHITSVSNITAFGTI